MQRKSRPYRVIKEKLKGNVDLTSFRFKKGGNVFVLSYQQGGKTRHTFLDAGDTHYRNQIIDILKENGIESANIDRIIISHRHGDHCGVADILSTVSGCEIVVHERFRQFVEEEPSHDEKLLMGSFRPSFFKECNMKYLTELKEGSPLSIGGMDFPVMSPMIPIGNASTLTILACPPSNNTHTPDQLLVLFSPQKSADALMENSKSFLPTDTIIFAGDLWLMKGPLTDQKLTSFRIKLTIIFLELRHILAGRGRRYKNIKEQDAEVKEALKRGFVLIRVRPGHHEEFLGSRIIPLGILADRDILMELGYPDDSDTAILKLPELQSKINSIKEQAVAIFVKELQTWIESGYSLSDVSELLVRIYKEQSGGGKKIARDRKQRRVRIKAILKRIIKNKDYPEEIRTIAQMTHPKLAKII